MIDTRNQVFLIIAIIQLCVFVVLFAFLTKMLKISKAKYPRIDLFHIESAGEGEITP